jgi:hypothetical protein
MAVYNLFSEPVAFNGMNRYILVHIHFRFHGLFNNESILRAYLSSGTGMTSWIEK